MGFNLTKIKASFRPFSALSICFGELGILFILPKIILGIDLGTTCTGYGVLECDGNRLYAVMIGDIDLHRMRDPYQKLRVIFERVCELVDPQCPGEVALESPFFGKNVQSMLKLGWAQELMKRKASAEPIGFNPLSRSFTLSQMQCLYEAVYGEPVDKRNFRKRIAEMDYIEKTGEIDKTGSKRGAALYKFSEKAYCKTPKFKL